ncbi:MAG TPA: GNAT family N-acetyltransferase [Gemmatimonadaceae bacterium]|nr:GNAT family N-acetyltransferase [Gemmatimonadaceae bacterium]
MIEERMEVRRGSVADAGLLAALASSTFADTFGGANRPEDLSAHLADAYGVEQQRTELADPRTVVLFAERAEETIGFAQLRESEPPPGVEGKQPLEILRFYVVRRWHGRGVAQRLMGAVLDEARRRGADVVWLGVWEKNPRAQAFYRKFGFEAVGAHEFKVGSDPQTDLIMARAL